MSLASTGGNNQKMLGLILAISLSALVISGCSAKDRQERTSREAALEPLAVRTILTQLANYPIHEELVGTIRPKLRARIEAKVSGRIELLTVDIGSYVKEGDLIAQLDVKEIQARLAAAQAQLERAKRDLQRYSSLLTQQAVTQAEFDGVQAQYRIAEGAFKEAESMLKYATIVAPFSGVVTRKWADVGDLVGPGRPIVELEDHSRLQVEVDVPESLQNFINLDSSLTVTVPATHITTTGVVREISPAADPSSRTFVVKLDLWQWQNVRPGQFAKVYLPVGTNRLIKVPQAAIVERGQLELLFVVTNNVARMRIVKTGKREKGLVEVLAGLRAGEAVVTDGAERLRDGQPVRTLPATVQ